MDEDYCRFRFVARYGQGSVELNAEPLTNSTLPFLTSARKRRARCSLKRAPLGDNLCILRNSCSTCIAQMNIQPSFSTYIQHMCCTIEVFGPSLAWDTHARTVTSSPVQADSASSVHRGGSRGGRTPLWDPESIDTFKASREESRSCIKFCWKEKEADRLWKSHHRPRPRYYPSYCPEEHRTRRGVFEAIKGPHYISLTPGSKITPCCSL